MPRSSLSCFLVNGLIPRLDFAGWIGEIGVGCFLEGVGPCELGCDAGGGGGGGGGGGSGDGGGGGRLSIFIFARMVLQISRKANEGEGMKIGFAF